MHINDRREVLITRVSLGVTLAASAVLFVFFAMQLNAAYVQSTAWVAAEVVVLAACVFFLIYGALLYQFCRLAYHQRRQQHVPSSRGEIEQLHRDSAPSLAVLVPSYKEEPRVVWQTLVSAALAEYPRKSVVLLIDDPPQSGSIDDRRKLEVTRRIPVALTDRFQRAAARYRRELAAFRARDTFDPRAEAARISELYSSAAQWVEDLVTDFVGESAMDALTHSDLFFVDEVLMAAAGQHAASSRDLERDGQSHGREFFDLHYRRLAGLFDTQFTSFERKQYANLSHESNKAMNLNAYIGLMGKSWRAVDGDGGRVLEETAQRADLVVPRPDYVITLDADSMLRSDYALRLVHEMERPGNARVGVTQTPYSAFPGCEGQLERIAGATTDLQYIVHQGFTSWNATFWVGANALIRLDALDDIRHTRMERGFEVPVFIHDRTVIEDTESSIDLIARGWSLFNYPERLAYSATPPDFGALLIQRRRWSNGGLLIAPKLAAYAWRAPKQFDLLGELFMRVHYLVSLAGGTAAVALIFLYPFDDRLATVWIPLSSLPYFVLYARDLRSTGYRYSDVLRVYALNLALLPVIAGGVLKSIHQGLTGAKVPFGRTPKVTSRSATPRLYAFAELTLPLFFFAMAIWDVYDHRWSHAVFSMVNGAFLSYAVFMIGARHLATDLGLVVAPEASPVGSELESVPEFALPPAAQYAAKGPGAETPRRIAVALDEVI